MNGHSVRFRVRYYETDKMGIIHHKNFVGYFEMGRTELLRSVGYPYAQLEAQGIFFVVTELHVEYKSNARYDEELEVQTRLGWIRHASVRFDYAVRQAAEGRLLATGWTVLACTDGKKVCRLPEPLLRKLESLRE